MTTSIHTHKYLIGVDGGGSGTRVVLADTEGIELARAMSGPSGLALYDMKLAVPPTPAGLSAACSNVFNSRTPIDPRFIGHRT